MNDLRDHFEEIAGPMHAVDSKQVEADLTRGRRALRRRRAVQAVAGSAFGVAALAAAFAVATSGGTPAVPADKGTASVASVQLVAYKGEQPKGFTVDKVPDGWFVQASEQGYLTVAPDKAKNPGPDVNPSTDPVYDKDSFADKIVIMLESKDQSGPSRAGKTVKVGDKEGVLLKSLQGVTPDGLVPPAPGGDTGSELWIKQPSGVYLIVQVWQGLGLTEAQIVELGAGVHVHKDAVQGVG
ncbi:hypothetical protein Aab01nite_67150 [Paractinoplanes abujensis]|uniref:Uncharacterized protein n=1 Tax=Paractinoplanes abujensis TaxID=882441 RepID=A0A7W7G446_9ACTN|nr:hypothetical protein [Actinoplanes abujensis]MBB4695542.1 hypothetical protein [Actinoplanes abujensis]GID23125.1 hypothetical protein Aab01nite_67150 [Actinoplanes abujensis]